MKASIVPAKGGSWQTQEIPEPKAGPGQVLIRIHASGICYTDVHQTHGDIPGDFPRILGHEPVGEIVEVGEGVTSRKIGDRVGVPWIQSSCGRCEWCQRREPFFCALQKGTSGNMQGGHAEKMVAYADATMLIPEGLSYEQAAPIFCAGYTVWSGLRWADPKPGERIAVVGIGGLGHLALQYSKAAGFHTLALSRSPDKDALIRDLGADQIVRDGQGLADAGGADVVLGTSNSNEAMADAIKGLRPDGRLVVMGFEAKPMVISPAELIMKRLKIIGSQQNKREYLYEALEIAASGKVRVMCEVFPFEKINEAYEKVETGKVRFRAVVKFG